MTNTSWGSFPSLALWFLLYSLCCKHDLVHIKHEIFSTGGLWTNTVSSGFSYHPRIRFLSSLSQYIPLLILSPVKVFPTFPVSLWLLSSFLASVVTPGYVFTYKDLYLRSTSKREHTLLVGYMQSSGITGSLGRFIFRFLKISPHSFPQCFHLLTLTPAVNEGSFAPHLCQNLSSFVLLILASLPGGRWNLKVFLLFISLITKCVEHIWEFHTWLLYIILYYYYIIPYIILYCFQPSLLPYDSLMLSTVCLYFLTSDYYYYYMCIHIYQS